ncbi:hypothetical protein WOLCODRAFT_95215 [Wolfiporia cocos MD-104 SS10]|uniref:Zn(2)-C6 fungal-type domain-containing protein n=1 Tax=Wolfiporia cocos (strain MD-104) TaxID=742152 RepID=A0A2H3IWI1_WOLCO|nr:hypothetical protein WOLCODRAFT_95215 [Wolfiporia cocos MD-104 SS10]
MGPVARTIDKDKPNGEPKQRRRPGRVPVSCAECRRLKLRCDRKVPCETCVKRGCSAICPEGSLTTGKGNRLALADAEELHKKIERLRERSAALEEALRTLQAAVSDEPHPLLRENAMAVGSSERASGPSISAGPLLSRDDEDILDAFGTLTLGLRGESRFFGQTSRSEYLIHAPTRSEPLVLTIFPNLPKSLVDEANIELEVPCTEFGVQAEIHKMLPSLSRACQLCEIFTEYGQFLWYPIPRTELFDTILGAVYQPIPDIPCSLAGVHTIALLFMVFALATLFDTNMPPAAIEAHEFYLLSRVCLRCAPPIHDTTLNAVQTMIYMAQYLEMSDCEPAHTGSHKAWLQINLAVKLGLSVGLHVNGSRWKLDEDASQKRGRVFWQLFQQDTWISFGFGRPPGMCLAFIDCGFPKDPDEKINDQGQKESGFHPWVWQYTRLLQTIMTGAFGAKPPLYSAVLDYDRKVRDFPIPYNLRPSCSPGPNARCNEGPLPQYMQRFFAILCKETTLLSLHRPFFSQALQDQPQDLLRHRYGPSVMAIYRSAWRIVEIAKDAYKRDSAVTARISFIWSHALAGGIVMCLLVTRAPMSPLAASSVQELDSLYELFKLAANDSQVASNNLGVIEKLQRQAHEMMKAPRTEELYDELDRLGGRTHLIAATYEPPTSCARGSNRDASASQTAPQPVSVPPIRTPALNNADPSLSVPVTGGIPVSADIIHPTIMQDLRALEGPESTIDYSQMDFGTFIFDMPPDSPLAQPQPQSQRQPDIGAGQDFLDEMFGAQAFPTPEQTPPVLDATWQSFVEQLGF